MLWLDRCKPQYRVIPPEIQTRLDAGNDFGDRAYCSGEEAAPAAGALQIQMELDE